MDHQLQSGNVDDKASRKFQKELNSGAISLVVLTTMEQLDRPAYGYEVAKLLESHAGDELPMNQAAIYPVLRSLEKQELLRSKMVPSDAGPPRKYYQLNSAGRRALASWKKAWKTTTSFVDSILENQDVANPSGTDRPVSSSARSSHQAKSRRRS